MSAAACYEDAAATRLLATRCASCGRPLVDAASVERGLGPDCAKRLGVPAHLDDAARAEANHLVYEMALAASGTPRPGYDAARTLARLNELGVHRLAARCAERMATIKIDERGAALLVWAPYRAEAVDDWRRVPGRFWDSTLEANAAPATREARLAVWRLLRKFYAGQLVIGPKGPFVLEALP